MERLFSVWVRVAALEVLSITWGVRSTGEDADRDVEFSRAEVVGALGVGDGEGVLHTE